MISEVVHVAAWEAAKHHKIDQHVLLAIITVESNGKPFKVRYEPKWSYFKDVDFWARHLGITEHTERVMQATSWGLCQVMGSVLRELGFDKDLPEACDPKLNCFYAAKKLAQLTKKYDATIDVIAAYNAGIPIRDKSGVYRNQGYVDKVLTALTQIRGKK